MAVCCWETAAYLAWVRALEKRVEEGLLVEEESAGPGGGGGEGTVVK